MAKVYSVIQAQHVKDYILRVYFSDGKINEVDFKNVVLTSKSPYVAPFKDVDKFKNYYIEGGNVCWGEDYDMIFPVHMLRTRKRI